MSEQLTPSQKRRLRELTDQVDRVSQADRRFFERFPHRRHRLRLASKAERKQFAIFGNWPPPDQWPSSVKLFVAVKNVAPGARQRLPVFALGGNGEIEGGEAGEAEAQAVFEEFAGPETRAMTARIQKYLEGNSR